MLGQGGELHPVVAEAMRRIGGRTVRAAADELGIPRSVWHRVSTGRQAPTEDTLNAICDAFPDLWMLRAATGRRRGAA